jgi:hypothetical protein
MENGEVVGSVFENRNGTGFENSIYPAGIFDGV